MSWFIIDYIQSFLIAKTADKVTSIALTSTKNKIIKLYYGDNITTIKNDSFWHSEMRKSSFTYRILSDWDII